MFNFEVVLSACFIDFFDTFINAMLLYPVFSCNKCSPAFFQADDELMVWVRFPLIFNSRIKYGNDKKNLIVNTVVPRNKGNRIAKLILIMMHCMALKSEFDKKLKKK